MQLSVSFYYICGRRTVCVICREQSPWTHNAQPVDLTAAPDSCREIPSDPEGRGAGSSPPRASETFEDSRRVTPGLYLVVNLLDRAVRADDEGSALDAHHLLAVHVLLFIDAVGFGGDPVLVRQQGERQIVLLFEFRLCRWLVRRDPDDRRALLAERLDFVAELAGLHRAARGIGPGIEVQHHAFALHCGEPEVFARVRLDVNIGSLIAYVQHASPQFLFE